MDTAARQREYLRVEAKFLDGQATTDRLMLVLLLSAPGAPFRDDARARGLLREYMGNDDDAYREFARFLLRSLNERRAMEQALDAERKHTQQLRKQVEELKAIEQDMNQRDQVKE